MEVYLNAISIYTARNIFTGVIALSLLGRRVELTGLQRGVVRRRVLPFSGLMEDLRIGN
jgi:hypothetical protein